MHTQKKLYSKSLRVQELSIVLVKQSYLVVEGRDKSAVAILRKLDRCDWTLGRRKAKRNETMISIVAGSEYLFTYIQ